VSVEANETVGRATKTGVMARTAREAGRMRTVQSGGIVGDRRLV
jgi:hypothetical protein